MKKKTDENQEPEAPTEEVITSEETIETEESKPIVVLGKAEYYKELFRGGQ